MRDVSFGVNFGEVFCLLGVNGAGKTSTFKSLTNEIKPTSGQLSIGDFDMGDRGQFSSARRLIGYCPQFDCLFKGFTVKEHLKFYANIKGVLPHMQEEVIQKQIIEMALTEYENVDATKLSGGNK